MFQLDMRSGKTVCEQVVDNIKEMIMIGVLPEEEKLPSVRDLSRQLTINPNTVQKAFKELERDGYIYTVTGRGTFVSPRSNIKTDDSKVNEALSKAVDTFKSLTYLGLEPEEAKARIISEIDRQISLSKEKQQ